MRVFSGYDRYRRSCRVTAEEREEKRDRKIQKLNIYGFSQDDGMQISTDTHKNKELTPFPVADFLSLAATLL